MNDVGKWLRDADPLAFEQADAGLARDEAQAMRRAMLMALAERPTLAALWPQPLAIAATIALTLASGIVLGRHLPPPRASASDLPSNAGEQLAELRQLQFATPGGTRVIWVFNPDFQP